MKKLTDSSELYICPPLPSASQKGGSQTQPKSYPRELCLQAGMLSGPFIHNHKVRCAVWYACADSSRSTFSHLHILGTQMSLNKTLTSSYPPGSVKFQAGTTGWHWQTCTILTCWHSSLKTSDHSLTSLFRFSTGLSISLQMIITWGGFSITNFSSSIAHAKIAIYTCSKELPKQNYGLRTELACCRRWKTEKICKEKKDGSV